MRIAILAALVALCWTPAARAATCTLTGTLKIQSLDSWYCDTGVLPGQCTGWIEQDLDSTDKPLKHMLVTVYTSNGQTLLGQGKTNSLGQYTVQWTQASCSGNVEFDLRLARIFENDNPGPGARYRFQLTNETGTSTWFIPFTPIPLTGATTTWNATIPRTTGTPDSGTKIANVYYTANSALTEMISWHSSLPGWFLESNSANIFDVRYNPDVDACASGCWGAPPAGFVGIAKDRYNKSSTLRHELGHVINNLLLRKGRSGSCGGYKFGNDTNAGHNHFSCEWARNANDEGIATFLGVRSVTTHDTNVWQCTCANNAIQHVCSNTVSLALGDPDRIRSCTGGTFAGVGDNFATTNSHCTRVSAAANSGCATCFSSPASCQTCPDTSPMDGECDNFQATWGFRNEHNVTRFLWDMIDTSTDSAQDDTDESMASLATLFFGIPCVSGSGYDVDGNCNEPNRASPASCEPTSEIGNAIMPMMGTRDSANAWDIGDIVPGSQTSERTINCVDTATD